MENLGKLGILGLEALRALVSLQNLAELVEENEIQERRWWARHNNARRHKLGASDHLLHEMRLDDDEEFFNFTRLTVEQFNEILDLVGPSIIQKMTRNDVISPYTRVLITLRYCKTIKLNNIK